MAFPIRTTRLDERSLETGWRSMLDDTFDPAALPAIADDPLAPLYEPGDKERSYLPNEDSRN